MLTHFEVDVCNGKEALIETSSFSSYDDDAGRGSNDGTCGSQTQHRQMCCHCNQYLMLQHWLCKDAFS